MAGPAKVDGRRASELPAHIQLGPQVQEAAHVASELAELGLDPGGADTFDCRENVLEHRHDPLRPRFIDHQQAGDRVPVHRAGQPARQVADQSLDNRGLDEAIVTRAQEISFGRLLAAEGQTTVALNATDTLVRHIPDGAEPVIAPPSA